MIPTDKTAWHMLCAKLAAANAAMFLRTKMYEQAQWQADKAKEHWLQVEWDKSE